MNRKLLLLACCLGFILVTGATEAAEAFPGESARNPAGDSAFAAMDYDRALALYQVDLDQTPGDAELLWRMARLEICRGDIAPREERDGFYKKGEEFARRSISADSTLSPAHTWLAAALGSRAMRGSSSQKVELAREIKRELDVAIELNPRDDGARSILGSFYRALGNISWIERQLANIFLGGIPSGGFEESEKELQTAIQIAPGVFRHHFELGLLYVDWERPEDALRSFQNALNAGPTMAADRHRIARAKKQIEALRESS